MRRARNRKELLAKLGAATRWHAFCKRQEMIQAARQGSREDFWAGKGVAAYAETVILSCDLIYLNAREKAEAELKANPSGNGPGPG